MAFEFFTETGLRKSTAPMVTITPRYCLSFNKSAASEWLDDDMQFARLGYDRETNQVAIEFHKEKCSGAFRITLTATNGAKIAAKSFIRSFDLTHEKPLRYTAERSGDLLVIDLNKPNKV
jgi:hypothetical protein